MRTFATTLLALLLLHANATQYITVNDIHYRIDETVKLPPSSAANTPAKPAPTMVGVTTTTKRTKKFTAPMGRRISIRAML